MVSGSIVLLAGSGLVGFANLAYNVSIARLLGPVGFAHATAVYTMLMLLSAVTLAFQIVCAKLVANHESSAEKAAVYHGLHRSAWFVGIAAAALLILGRGAISSFLNLPNHLLIVLLAVGTAFYVPLGSRRGGMQGTYAFNRLAGNFVVEGLVRLGGALLLVEIGWGVNGAVLASIAAVVVAYVFAFQRTELKAAAPVHVDVSPREGMQAMVFFAGQVVINNFDIILVKHFFPANIAGLYAAIALVGRLVNMTTWSVINTMFPISAGATKHGRERRGVLLTSLILVVVILICIVAGLALVPHFFWRMVFGSHFAVSSALSISIPSLLVLYAVSSGVYALSAVIIAYEMSRKIANTAWVQLAFSGVLVAGMYLFHSSLHQIILVQLDVMLLLLAVVLFPVLRTRRRASEEGVSPVAFSSIRKVRPLSEAEVIGEFLKNEYHHPEFDLYRDQFTTLLSNPDWNDSRENELRRALLFLRRGAMWRELPAGTQWFDIELTAEDLSRIRVFPRAQWRRAAQGSFLFVDVVERIRSGSTADTDPEFPQKLRLLSTQIQAQLVNRTVLLIGEDASGPLTILDGNHRMAAAMLLDPPVVVETFRFICGFSPEMTGCCWYQTNLSTLLRYAGNLLKYMSYDPDLDIGRLMAETSTPEVPPERL